MVKKKDPNVGVLNIWLKIIGPVVSNSKNNPYVYLIILVFTMVSVTAALIIHAKILAEDVQKHVETNLRDKAWTLIGHAALKLIDINC